MVGTYSESLAITTMLHATERKVYKVVFQTICLTSLLEVQQQHQELEIRG
jgi:hypothetical protein